MAVTALGGNTITIFLQHEMHKLHIEFEAATALKQGQPVELNMYGKIIPWVKTHGRSACIGVTKMDAASGKLCTVQMRGMCIINALSNAACSPGPAVYEGMGTGDNTMYSKYGNADITGTSSPYIGLGDNNEKAMAWILDAADSADDIIRVVIMD